MTARAERRSFWTWGYVSDEPNDAQRQEAARRLADRIGEQRGCRRRCRPLTRFRCRRHDSRSRNGWRLGCRPRTADRITHTYGGHSLELLKALRGEFDHPPDAVAHPRDEDELEATLDWCDRGGFAAIPYGGGTSVVWGVNVPPDANAAVTIDLDNLNAVLEVDEVSRAARIQAGILGPDLEAALKPRGLTLRHFPQSFPWSTVGGWVATRSGGHYATNHTHIDDFVESTRMLTPRGWFESRRLPGSGAGPSPDRLVLGSEGTLGIITECWLRLQKRPVFRATAGVRFPSWQGGCDAVREIAQAKLWPANLRILDPAEAEFSAHGGEVDDDAILVDDGSGSPTGRGGAVGVAQCRREYALLIIGFESSEIPQGANIHAAVDGCKSSRRRGRRRCDPGRRRLGPSPTGRRAARFGAWRKQAFIGVNAGLTAGLGLLADTFETAITWDRWPDFDAEVRERVLVRDPVLDAGYVEKDKARFGSGVCPPRSCTSMSCMRNSSLNRL